MWLLFVLSIVLSWKVQTVWAVFIPQTKMGIEWKVAPIEVAPLAAQPFANWLFSDAESFDIFSLGCHQEADFVRKRDSLSPPCRGVQVAWQRSMSSPEPITSPPARKPAFRGEVVVTEVMWAGSYDGNTSLSNDEWIELYNTTPDSLDLQGMKMVGVKAGNGAIIITSPLRLEPYGFVVIGSRKDSQTLLFKNPDLVISDFVLNNTATNISLVSESGTVLDHMPIGIWEAGVNDTQNHRRFSAQRIDVSVLETSWENWTNCHEAAGCGVLPTQVWKRSADQNQATPWLPTNL